MCCRATLQGFKEELKQWDLTFWSEQLREAKYNISDEALRPYFSLPNVLDGLFKVSLNLNLTGFPIQICNVTTAKLFVLAEAIYPEPCLRLQIKLFCAVPVY